MGIEELKEQVNTAEATLREAQDALGKAMIAAHPIKPGMVVEYEGEEHLVTIVKVKWDRVMQYGRKKTKAGWHAKEREIWCLSGLPKILRNEEARDG